jgi:hypothetical protein
MDCVTVKVHTPGVGQACGEGETIGWSVAEVWYLDLDHVIWRSSQSKDKYQFSIYCMLCMLYTGYNVIKIVCIYIYIHIHTYMHIRLHCLHP